MENYIGKKLEGRYELKEIIGIGGMAIVYKAYDSFEDKYVAVKVLKEEYITNEEFVRRFKNESKAIAVLSHPNIVKVFDVCFSDTIQYIVMEYIDGITLKQYIEQQGNLRWKDALNFVVQILRALQHAHDHGIVHRDVKPQNIMVLSNGAIKVTDFGIARFARSEQKTITDKAIGSVHYISPEQARGDNTDEKSDLYSLGVILYEMLTGQLPFQAESAVSVAIMQLQRDPELPTSINGSIPLGLEQITMHAMQKNSEKRYKSASEMLCDLEAFKRDPAISFDYGYYVDEQPTRFISDVKAEKKAKKIQFLPILVGITIAFVVTVLIVFIPFVMDFFSKVEEIDCPNFVGSVYEDILKGEYGDDFVFVDKRIPNEAKAGIVIGQSQSAGRAVKKGSKIVLTVSDGPGGIVTESVPNVSGKTREEAERLLNSKGFYNIKFEEISNKDFQQGLVISTNPGANTIEDTANVITVYVSTGEATAKVKIPSCVGLSQESAKRLLEIAGLKVGEVTVKSFTGTFVEEGIVMEQNPSNEEGVEVPYGSTVDLVVSSGKYDVEITIDFSKIIAEGLTSGTVELRQFGAILEHTQYGEASIEVSNFAERPSYTFNFESPDAEIECNLVVVDVEADQILTSISIRINCAARTYEFVEDAVW